MNTPKLVVGAVMLLFGVFLAIHTPWQWVPLLGVPGGRMLTNVPVFLYAIFGPSLYLGWALTFSERDGQ
jgi:hypothetical protein